MAHPQVGSSVSAKLSFAKIVAMPAPNVTPAVPNINKDNKSNKRGVGSQSIHLVNSISNDDCASKSQDSGTTGQQLREASSESVRLAMQGLTFTHKSPSNQETAEGIENVNSPSDDQSQISASSFKHQSFETKSMASVTTFAMDEKESIRPDDSASVRAVDEDDIQSGLSRASSFQQEVEQNSGAQRLAMRNVAPNVTIAARRYPGIPLANPPRFGDLPVDTGSEVEDTRPTVVEIATKEIDTSRSRLPVLMVTPDEKLLEALTSLKDRLPLLQLEEKIMSFVTQNHDDVLQLPPQNSFTRLLTHKLADYYNLAHQVTEDNTSVRIFRTPCCSLPTPLAEIARTITIGASQASNAAQVKIMRRAQLGQRQFSAGNSTAASSSVPSKATSENGLETNSDEGLQSPIDGTPSKDKSKLTREEREAQYKAARERIFGDFTESVTSENGSTGETSASMSRSSSSSGRRKARKQRSLKDDSFEARSAFVASYAPMHVPPAYQQSYSEMQFPGTYATQTNNYPQSIYGQNSMQGYPAYENSNMSYGGPVNHGAPLAAYASNDGWQGLPQSPQNGLYDFQIPTSYQSHSKHVPQVNNHYQQVANPVQLGWSGSQPQSPYGHPSQPSSEGPWQQYNPSPNLQSPVPYQYGQLPPQGFNSAVPFSNQHPIPGSYSNSRSLFNPQTRSFIPSNASGRGNGRGNRKKSGQTSSNSRSGNTSGTGSPALGAKHDSGSASPSQAQASLQQKYGTPANLPKKPPPPSQIIPHFIADASASQTPVVPLPTNGTS